MTTEAERLAARRPALLARARMARAVRAYFEREGFVEVETPARVFNPGQELHLDAIAAEDDRFLITSPEHHMKRLLAGGFERVVQMGRSFRRRETGPHHQPEFTMIEWYRAGEALDAVARDCEELVRVVAEAAGVTAPVRVPPGRARDAAETIDLRAPVDRTTVRALLREHAGVDVRGDETVTELRAKLTAAGHRSSTATSWDDLFFEVFLDRVEPHLGRGAPTLVFDWPVPLGALARRKADNPAVVERFELYAGGLELVNAFGELTDAAEQRARFQAERDRREALGKTVYPVDDALLAALPNLPPTAGAALGFDRLVMLALGADDIREVVAFADDET